MNLTTWDDFVESREINREKVNALAEQMLAECRAYRLREVRDAYLMTQEQVAAEMNVSQRRVSEIEKGQINNTRIDTLKRYVEALGGQFEATARFGDTTYQIA